MPFRLVDPAAQRPIILPDGTEHAGTVHLAPVCNHPRANIGDFTYASDFDPPDDANWIGRLAPYLFDFSEDRLEIGRFCQIAHGVRFITASATHDTAGFTSYPFAHFDRTATTTQPDTRNIVVGHDVWFGHGAMILAGAHIGSGAIIGAGAVVRGTVPAYAIVTGNPGTVLRMRFPPKIVDALLRLAWWDWPKDNVQAATDALLAGDLNALEQFAP